MNEVCSVTDTSQFSPNKSVEKCGFYSISLLKHAGKPGQSPIGNANDVASWADAEYVRYDGPDVSSNGNGMTMGTLEAVLHDAGLHYQVIASTELGYSLDHLNATYIRGWLKHGYPVIIAVAEDDVFDLDLEAKPYAWNTAGYYHIITATGIASDGNLLCHDTASIDNNGVRHGPRRYDASRLQNGLTSATAVVMPWLARPTDTFDPLKENVMPIPANWKDENGKLIAPNGHFLVRGFREHVLNAASWSAGDMPLEEEQHVSQVELHTNRGAGVRQITAEHLLVYTDAMGVKESLCGQEIAKCYNIISTLEQQLKTANTEIATLKAQHAPPASSVIGESITALQAQIASLNMVKSDAEELLKIAQPMATGLDVALVTAQNVVNKLSGK